MRKTKTASRTFASLAKPINQVRKQLFALLHAHSRVAFLPTAPLVLKASKLLPFPRIPETLGDHLLKRRHELGLRQKDVAERLGVDDWTVLNWEKGKTGPAVHYLPRIIAFLGYDPFPAATTLGEKIAAGRRLKGLSKKRLAAFVGADEITVARWERDESLPEKRHAMLLRQLLALGA